VEAQMSIDARPADAACSPPSPTATSLALIRACRLSLDDPIIAVGDVDAQLIAALRRGGYQDVTVLDPSLERLEGLRAVLGDLERELLLIEADVLTFRARRRYALWHDRAFFHRLTHADDRQRYVEVLQYALRPEGHLIINAFGPEGPEDDRGVPAERYSASRLAAELGAQFELAEQGLVLHREARGPGQQLLHCRFWRHAPR
jgi:hypothetical protein